MRKGMEHAARGIRQKDFLMKYFLLPHAARRTPHVVFAVLLFCSASLFALGETPSGGSAGSSFRLAQDDLAFFAGSSILKGQAGIALGLRGKVTEHLNWEVGGTIPHPVSGLDKQSVPPFTNGPFTETDTAHIRSFSETHLAARLPWRSGNVGVDLITGLSIGMIGTRSDQLLQPTPGSPRTFAYDATKVSVSPWLGLGAAWSVTPRLTLGLDVLYVNYSATSTNDFSNPSFNLGISAALLQPTVSWKF